MLARSNDEATIEIRNILVMETTAALIFYLLYNKHNVYIDQVS